MGGILVNGADWTLVGLVLGFVVLAAYAAVACMAGGCA